MRTAAAATCVALAVLIGTAPPPTSARAFVAAGLAQPAGPGGGGESMRTVRVGFARGSSYSVTTLPMETYVARVLAGEAQQGSAPAALDALAITVRTYALANRGRHQADGFDLCDTTHCQVVRQATVATERAAERTAGRILLHEGLPASVYYSASCGGRTEMPSAVWPGATNPPYLPSKPDDGCGGGPVWSAELDAADLQRALRASGFRGSLRDMRVTANHESGRVAVLALEGLTPATISGQDLRTVVGRALGWNHILSAQFELRREGRVYRFNGHGSGHGVGLCVIGSARLAAGGVSAEAILDRYFPGTSISGPSEIPKLSATVPPELPPGRPSPVAATPAAAAVVATDVTISLPEGEEGERGALLAMTRHARDDLAGRLQVAAPTRVTVRAHATTGDYERATGQPPFSSAATTRGEIHLAPLAALRDRGVLERTIRRELVRMMADETLARRPLWVKVGVALYFADTPAVAEGQRSGPAVVPGRSNLACPSDGVLASPVSIGAMATALAGAKACVARQMAGGRSWREVR